MKKFFLIISTILMLTFLGCGSSSSKEAKELLQRILTFVGIPQEIIVNICQDGNDNGFCDSSEIITKLTINKSDSLQDIVKKLEFDIDGNYTIKPFDPTKKILMEIVDNEKVKNTGQHVTLSYNPKEGVHSQELSILQSLVDNELIAEEEMVKIRESDVRAELDRVLLENLFENQNTLIEHNMSRSDATVRNLEYIAEGLRDIDISEGFIGAFEGCEGNISCQTEIIQDADEQTQINEKEATSIADTNSTEGTGDRTTSITVEENNSTNETENNTTNATNPENNDTTEPTDDSSPNSSGEESEPTDNQKTEKNVADGYLLKLKSPAIAQCPDMNPQFSGLTVGAKGKITFEGSPLTADCIITIPSGATIDSNNDGNLSSEDKNLSFEMKAPADVSFISPLSTLLLAKMAHENMDSFKDMVKDFDPVICASNIANSDGTEKMKNQKLMILMEVLKTSLRYGANISDINISSILENNESNSLDDFNIDALLGSFSPSIQSLAYEKASRIKKLIQVFDLLDSNLIDMNSLYINISDAERYVEDSIYASLKSPVPLNRNLLFFIVKDNVDLIQLYDIFASMEWGSLNSMDIPIAQAGRDISVLQGTNVNLNGIDSVDINGEITSYEWREGNTTLSTNISFIKRDFSVGEHNITLTITDDNNLTDTDTIVVTILPNPLTKGLLGYYPLDGNSNDISGNARHGISFGDFNYTDGVQGESAKFDGINDYISIDNEPAFNDSNISFSFYVKTTAPNIESGNSNGWSYVVAKGTNYDYQYAGLMISGGQNLAMATSWYADGGSIYKVQTPYDNIKDGKWHHYVSIITSEYSSLYKDGILIDKNTTQQNSPWNTNGNANITIGGIVQTDNDDGFFEGYIDEMRIYNRILSESEIQELFELIPLKKLKKTGQTKSYDTDGDEVTDNTLKDDGLYQKGLDHNYTRDNSTDIVIDNITGLMWQDDSNASSVQKSWITQDNYNAGDYNNTTGDTAATYCSDLDFSGYDDWRLPTIEELELLPVYNKSNPSIDSSFINISSDTYWSSSDLDGDKNNNAWRIIFVDGAVSAYLKNNQHYVRCVRDN